MTTTPTANMRSETISAPVTDFVKAPIAPPITPPPATNNIKSSVTPFLTLLRQQMTACSYLPINMPLGRLGAK